MDHFSMTILWLVGGTGVATGFSIGTAVFARVLRQRERRIAYKIAALEYLRQHEHIDVHPIVEHLVDRQQEERAVLRQPRRWSR